MKVMVSTIPFRGTSYQLLLILCVLCASAVGLLLAQEEKPPKTIQVDTWVTYQIKRSEKQGAAFTTVWTSELKISILSEERLPRSKEKYYWVELVANEKAKDSRVVKFLIDSSGKPVLEKLIIKHPDLNPVEIDLKIWSAKTNISPEQLFQEMVGNFLVVPFTPPETNPVRTEQINLKATPKGGSASGMIKGKDKIVESQRYLVEKEKEVAKLWFAQDIPFPGLAKMLIFSADGERYYQTQIILVDYDTKGAASLIKERPMKLEFKEGK